MGLGPAMCPRFPSAWASSSPASSWPPKGASWTWTPRGAQSGPHPAAPRPLERRQGHPSQSNSESERRPHRSSPRSRRRRRRRTRSRSWSPTVHNRTRQRTESESRIQWEGSGASDLGLNGGGVFSFEAPPASPPSTAYIPPPCSAPLGMSVDLVFTIEILAQLILSLARCGFFARTGPGDGPGAAAGRWTVGLGSDARTEPDLSSLELLNNAPCCQGRKEDRERETGTKVELWNDMHIRVSSVST